MAAALTEVAGSSRRGADKPCRSALRLDFERPAAVLGPVLFFALARLAAICFSLAIDALHPDYLAVSSGPPFWRRAERSFSLRSRRRPLSRTATIAVEQLQAFPFDLRRLGLQHCRRYPVLGQVGNDLLLFFGVGAEKIQGVFLMEGGFTDILEIEFYRLEQRAIDQSDAGTPIALLLPKLVDVVIGVDPVENVIGLKVAHDRCAQTQVALFVLAGEQGRGTEQMLELVDVFAFRCFRRHLYFPFARV